MIHLISKIDLQNKIGAVQYPFGWMPSGNGWFPKFSRIHLAINRPEAIVSAKICTIAELNTSPLLALAAAQS